MTFSFLSMVVSHMQAQAGSSRHAFEQAVPALYRLEQAGGSEYGLQLAAASCACMGWSVLNGHKRTWAMKGWEMPGEAAEAMIAQSSSDKPRMSFNRRGLLAGTSRGQ
jgi:hypothetical protein